MRNKILIAVLIISSVMCVFVFGVYVSTGKEEREQVNVIAETISSDLDEHNSQVVTDSTIEETTQAFPDISMDSIRQSIIDSILNNTSSKTKVSLPVNIIYQYPDMPSGCEITSLTMILNYMGINVSNKYLADNYLDTNEYDMFKSFVGSVYDDHSFGCFAPVIVKAANNFFADNNINAEAVDISGSTRDEIYDYIEDGDPVIIWNTQEMKTTYIKEYNIDGNIFTWYANEHCVVICGYDKDNNTVEIADSIAGKVTRDADTFFQRYEDMLSQAVYIRVK
ncbi:MAG: C39 family peptidase [Clostridia bacterium]|nr:C39 family peptidase [Clostridia bacterium]